MNKRCTDCGRFMRLTDRMPEEDEVDEELAAACGLSQDEIDEIYQDIEAENSRFIYVNDQWECDNCNTLEPHTEGKRYYWNPESGHYNGEKPLTPAEKAALENKAQEEAGQMRLIP